MSANSLRVRIGSPQGARRQRKLVLSRHDPATITLLFVTRYLWCYPVRWLEKWYLMHPGKDSTIHTVSEVCKSEKNI